VKPVKERQAGGGSLALRTVTGRLPDSRDRGGSVATVNAASLTAIPLFAELELDRRDQLAGVCAELEVEPGTTLVQEGDFGYAIFAIVDGTAEVTQGGSPVRRLGPGDVFGEIAILSGGRRTATVVATAPMKLITIMNRDVWRLERESPAVARSLRQTIADCLQA
jgi:CRP-like cAMP-binding protein